MLAQGEAVHLQVSLAEPDEEGRRTVAIHSRAERAGEDPAGGETQWTCHASGVLAPAADVDPEIERLQAQVWPPADAEPVEIEYLYDRLAELGLSYGTTFRAVRRAWRRGEELFVEVALGAEAERFGMHPALLDATLHPLFGEHAGVGLPFSWSDVRLYREGASALRVCVVLSGGDTLRLAAVDELGAPVLSIGSLLGRSVERRPARECPREGKPRLTLQPRVGGAHRPRLPRGAAALRRAGWPAAAGGRGRQLRGPRNPVRRDRGGRPGTRVVFVDAAALAEATERGIAAERGAAAELAGTAAGAGWPLSLRGLPPNAGEEARTGGARAHHAHALAAPGVPRGAGAGRREVGASSRARRSRRS